MRQTTSILPLSGRMLLYTHLRTMVNSGTPLAEGLEFLARDAPHRGVRQAGEHLRRNIGAGDEGIAALLAPSLPPEEGALLAVGEQTGRLVPILDTLIERCDQKLQARNDLLKRSVYPLFVVIMSGVILPIPTVITQGGGAYGVAVLGHLLWVGLVLAGVYGVVRLWARTRSMALRRVPGGIELALLPQSRADFLRVLRGGITSGLPLGLTLDAAARVWLTDENAALTHTALRRIESGDRLGDAVQPILTRAQTFEIAAAERSGTLDESLGRLVTDADKGASARRRVVAIVTAGIIGLAVLGMVAIKITGSLKKAVMPDGGVMEQLQREVQGTGIQIFEAPSLGETMEWSGPKGAELEEEK
ncbi:MAG: type II secretion system F family protein [Pseudomonadota bacterium]